MSVSDVDLQTGIESFNRFLDTLLVMDARSPHPTGILDVKVRETSRPCFALFIPHVLPPMFCQCHGHLLHPVLPLLVMDARSPHQRGILDVKVRQLTLQNLPPAIFRLTPRLLMFCLAIFYFRFRLRCFAQAIFTSGFACNVLLRPSFASAFTGKVLLWPCCADLSAAMFCRGAIFCLMFCLQCVALAVFRLVFCLRCVWCLVGVGEMKSIYVKTTL